MYAPTVFFSCFALLSRALRRAAVARKVVFTLRRCFFGNGGRPIFAIISNNYMSDNMSSNF